MEEIYQIADRITVLRDGALVLTRSAQQLPRQELIRAMVGAATALHPNSDGAAMQPARFTFEDAPRGGKSATYHADVAGPPGGTNAANQQRSGNVEAQPTRLRVSALGAAGSPKLCDISFEATARQILGVCGLGGSGAGELLQVLGGARTKASGVIEWDGTALSIANPGQAFAAGFAYLPPDRQQSVFAALSLLCNGTMSALGRYSRVGVIARARSRRDVAALAEKLALAHGLDTRAGSLSGGNQQKLALLRCLLAEPKLLLLAEPTRGVDIAAKQALHQWIRELAARGLTVILQSSELDELLSMCHRILVLHRGRSVALIDPAEFSRERLLSAMMGNPA